MNNNQQKLFLKILPYFFTLPFFYVTIQFVIPKFRNSAFRYLPNKYCLRIYFDFILFVLLYLYVCHAIWKCTDEDLSTCRNINVSTVICYLKIVYLEVYCLSYFQPLTKCIPFAWFNIEKIIKSQKLLITIWKINDFSRTAF